MLCSTCGEEIQFENGIFICKICDSEFDALELDEGVIPKPTFVTVNLKPYYTTIDTRRQTVNLRADSEKKQI